ncbi:MAG: isoprenylcysteine carboxylmethyltransferase family protein [Chlorobi bacterium]|nr:isoprenylcysteine carboxylmethyltransferase family protein [Chlorobiota bacterium]
MFLRLAVWIIMIFGGAALSIYFDGIYFDSLFHNVWFHIGSFLIGAMLTKAVITVSKNTGRTLAKYGRKGKIKRMETNVLVKEGIYKLMRHPMHLGLLFFPVAVALLLGSPTFIFIIAPLDAFFMLAMIKLIEEPEAIGKFDGEYLKYMKETPMFCFSGKCLKELFRKVEKNN